MIILKSQKKALGYHGESLALNHLILQGYEIIEANFFCKLGEIDIIARDNKYICFVEVKTRYGPHICTALESITYSKTQKIKKAAKFYIQQNNLHKNFFRFDAIEILLNEYSTPKINLIKDAFRL
ncbi:YraN family protein [Clostridium putrefaciens]|uniref:YraN family protein n=1 Tax=Clostridium putrefaciens TaxID=99675 RepID=UPI001FA88212|nr:YraN family protein [Clostridium putrefaciens]